MSKYLLTFALILCGAPALAGTDIPVELYGEINVSYDSNDPGDDDWESYVSRLGLKGAYKLNDNLQIVYQVEQEVDVVSGGTERDTLLGTRNSFVGLKGKYGTIYFGAHDTPFKKAQNKMDQFNDQAGDIKNLLVGEVRAKDSWFYHSPKYKGWQFQGMLIPSDSNFDSSKSASLLYKSDDWDFGFGVDADTRKNDRSVNRTNVYDSLRASAQFTPGSWKFGLIVQRSEQQNAPGADSETGYVASVAYKLNNWSLLAQHGDSDIVGSDVTSSNVGVHYNFTKGTKAYIYYWDYDKGGDSDTLSIGVEHKF